MTSHSQSRRIVLLAACAAVALSGCEKKAAVVVAPANGATMQAVNEPSAEPPKEPPPRPEKEPPARPEKEPAVEAFAFPVDRGGQLLSKLLPPPDRDLSARDGPPVPFRRSGPAAIEEPALPLPPTPSAPPRLPLGARSSARPESLANETLAAGRLQMSLPAPQTLPAGAGIRLPSVNVHEPPALPRLAAPVADRASLDDPTIDASSAAALAAPPAARPGPAPFQRFNLPDPFEHRLTLRSTPLPDDNHSPPAGTARLPRQ
jgi:hypothetical protein